MTQPTQSCIDIANRDYTLAAQIMETCQAVYDGSEAAGSWIFGPDERIVEVIINADGRIERWDVK